MLWVIKATAPIFHRLKTLCKQMFFTVLFQRLKAAQTDKYTDVQF